MGVKKEERREGRDWEGRKRVGRERWDERGEERGDGTRKTNECFQWISQVKLCVMPPGTTEASSYSTVGMT